MFKTPSYSLVLLFLFAALSPANVYSQTASDTSSISVRHSPVNKVSKYAHSKTFQYGAIQKPESVWQKIQAWVWKQFLKLFKHKTTKNILGLSFLLLFIVIVVMLIKQFSDAGLFRTQNNPPATFSVEEMTRTPADFQPQIQNAITNKNYNLAIRLLYKNSLIQLQKRGCINWQKNKTNHAYIYEITEHNLQQIFRALTRYYEYAEYGKISISEVKFQQAYKQFKRMESIINSSSPK